MNHSGKRATLTLLCGVNLLWAVTAAEIGAKDFKPAHLFLTHERFGSKKGALFKPGARSPIFLDLGDDWKSYEPIYGPKTESTIEQRQRVIAFSKLVSKASDAEFADELDHFFDLDQLARFMAVTVYLSSMDSILGMGQNSAPVLARSFPSAAVVQASDFRAGARLGSETGGME